MATIRACKVTCLAVIIAVALLAIPAAVFPGQALAKCPGAAGPAAPLACCGCGPAYSPGKYPDFSVELYRLYDYRLYCEQRRCDLVRRRCREECREFRHHYQWSRFERCMYRHGCPVW